MLTKRQAEILAYVENFQERHGTPPSTREVARTFNTSQPTAFEHLRALARKGRIEKLADGRLGIKAANRGRQIEIPIYGYIPAGVPVGNEQETSETVAIDPQLFGFRPADFTRLWALRITGDSMERAGIFAGDLAIMLKREPSPGEIIAALVDGTATTLKRLIRTNGRLVLRAANRKYGDIRPTHLEAQGVLVGLIRTDCSLPRE